MTDSMKFGPEWLRNLAGDNSSTGGGGGGLTSLTAPRYQLADHRYGREEMLALFDRNYKPPETLSSFGAIFAEKAQLPLALIQMTEDETRMWNGGVTSASGRGRGGSVDRGGRGRTGRGGLYSSPYSRGVGFEEPGDGSRLDTQPFPGRGRPFDRSQSERGWSERNGIPEPGEWNGSTSPRKELSRGTSGGSLMESNWRRHRGGGEEEDGWRSSSNNRTEKWGGKSSWRDGGSADKDRADGEGDENRSGGRWDHRGNHRSSYDSSHHSSTRTSRPWDPNHHDNHDNLPEWATENPSESGGSFDASGAFHGGMYSDDEDGGPSGDGSQDSRVRSVSEGNSARQNNKSAPYNNSGLQSTPTGRPTYKAPNSANKERPKSLHPFEDKETPTDQERRSLSPVKTPAPRPSNTPIKAPPATPESKVRLENFSSRKPLPTEAPDDKGGERNPTTDSKLTEKKFKENNEGNLNIDPAVIMMSRQPPQKSLGFMKMGGMPVTADLQKRDEDLDRMKEEADALYAKLMADEKGHRGEAVIPPETNTIPGLDASNVSEKWFYRDPQGEVQGPFMANEMAEWWKQGYFSASLLVRRTCDERYASLGDLMNMCGRVPFKPGPAIPPLKLTGQIPTVPNPVLTGMPGTLPKPAIEDPMLLLQYQRLQLMQNQQFFIRQMAIAKLSQSEHWSSLTPVEQNQLVLQYVLQDSELPEMPVSHNPFLAPIATQATNPVMQLFNQMQAKSQIENHMAPGSHPGNATHSAPLGFLQQMIQERSAQQNIPGMQQSNIAPTPAPTQEDNPMKSLLRQLNVHANGHPQVQVDSVWPQPPPHMTATPFNAQNWLAQVGPIPAMPPGQIPNSLWDIHGKDIKTEQQILEEQNLRLQEGKKEEEFKKLEELKRKEELVKRQQEELAKLAKEVKRQEEEKKRIEEEKKRKDEEKFKLEEELRKKEEKKRKEEERKKEEKRKQDEELNRKKQEEEKKRKEEAKRQEEKLRKEEEKRKKLEEEQKRQEEEARRKEEEALRKAEAEEQAKKAEQRRREQEALRKLQERSKAPWAQASASVTQASLAEIQKLEKEKKAEQQRFQQIMQIQVERQKALEAAQESATMDSSKRLQFKWAEKTAGTNKQPQVKSLAQIQQEEQERIAKEREKQEKTTQKESAIALQNAGIWGTASQSLTWASSASSGNQAWASGSSSGGFWDDLTPTKANAGSKQQTKQTAVKVPAPQPQPQPQQLNNKAVKNKNKREEDLVKKLFEQNTSKPDDFTHWCTKSLTGLQVSVDIPTFIGFLRDIESAYEVKEYVRLYLGDDKLCMDFAKQFLEKRSKWRSSQRPQAQADDLCKPAPAINPNASAEFQEVKGKSKKPKKGKMFKVDSRILGFSVTSAPDRINVGDRDYGEGF